VVHGAKSGGRDQTRTHAARAAAADAWLTTRQQQKGNDVRHSPPCVRRAGIGYAGGATRSSTSSSRSSSPTASMALAWPRCQARQGTHRQWEGGCDHTTVVLRPKPRPHPLDEDEEDEDEDEDAEGAVAAAGAAVTAAAAAPAAAERAGTDDGGRRRCDGGGGAAAGCSVAPCACSAATQWSMSALL